ncbi:DUF5787 family protein [Candidatus Halobonum tyrrellensis]|uniref:Uncharacterized protein n=1 Tax=Candidatus Halobonum tyrrellensis G22 TaxID=1324957 RepID=V4HHC2_9EURY|nr:DUF5787 family protein [Candidatus Halobonum tyrrellensis]ESP87269.1 hypothetical protein K933_14323 [Candidatus Halobonum tyrrellensis G22]
MESGESAQPGEFGFELALCAHLERATDWVVARQLGAAVVSPGSRVMDVVGVVPGPGFDARARLTDRTVPDAAIDADVGVGEARYWRDAFDRDDDWAREALERAVDCGFFERERRGGRTYVRQAARYPDDWVGKLVGIENKPDLGRPGDLRRQARVDAALGLFDEVWVATESHVTGAHLNRLPASVGVWRFDPETGDRTVVREATPLAVDEPGVEVRDEHPLRTDVAFVTPAAKARRRRRVAERAYGKGWRTYEFPACTRCVATDDGRPRCDYFGRVVDPATACGPDCPGHEAGDPPAVDADLDALRGARTPWVRDPAGAARRQSGLDRFG